MVSSRHARFSQLDNLKQFRRNHFGIAIAVNAMVVRPAVKLNQRRARAIELDQPSQNHCFGVILALHQNSPIVLASISQRRWARHQIENRSAHRTLPPGCQSTDQPIARYIQMQYHRSRHFHTCQYLVETFGLPAGPRKAVKNNPARGRSAPQPRAHCLAHHLVVDQRTRGQNAPQSPACSRTPPRPRSQHIAGRQARNSQLPRQPGTLRPFTAPRRTQKQNDPGL